jgi:hypothetical protein
MVNEFMICELGLIIKLTIRNVILSLKKVRQLHLRLMMRILDGIDTVIRSSEFESRVRALKRVNVSVCF